MIRPYLIQRARFEKREAKGIDALLRFDYMGSSEFEWGALPEALKRTRENKKEYIQFEFTLENFKDKPIMILCKEFDKEELPKILEQLAKAELRLKEYCDLDDYLKGNKDYRTSDFWWDIENDYFFWRSNEEFNNNFKDTLFLANTGA
jgi:hypothetical protein